MGLLMYRESEPLPSKAVVKSDPTALQRSTIRRQAAVRHRSNPLTQARSGRLSPRSERHALLEIVQRDRGEREWQRPFETPPTWNSGSNTSYRDETIANFASEEASNRHRLEAGRILLRNSLSLERERLRRPQEPSFTIVRGPIPIIIGTDPDAENGDFQVDHPRLASSRSSAHRLSRGMRSRRVAPAHRLVDGVANRRRDDPAVTAIDAISDGAGRELHETPNDFPALERQRRLSPRPRDHRGASPPIFTFDTSDGLGDRRRSPSPEVNAWETLLTTITPDERLPTPTSSFTSASASATSLSSRIISTSSTLLTAPSSNAVTVNALSHICDEFSESEFEDDCPPGDYTSDLGRHGTAGEPPLPDPSRYTGSAYEEVRRTTQDLSDRVARANRRASERHELLQAILDRLDGHEAIPDEWWAAVGLDANLGVRTERVERERL